MADVDEARAAIEALNGREHRDRPLTGQRVPTQADGPRPLRRGRLVRRRSRLSLF